MQLSSTQMRPRHGLKDVNGSVNQSRERYLAREATVETYLKKKVEELGGACEKHTNPGHRSDPDRLVTIPWTTPYHCLIETKWAQGVVPPRAQLRRHRWWIKRGFNVVVLCTKDEVDAWVASILLARFARD